VDGVDGRVRRVKLVVVAKRRECNGQVDGVPEPLAQGGAKLRRLG